MARPSKSQAAEPTEPSPKADGEAAAGVANAPVTPAEAEARPSATTEPGAPQDPRHGFLLRVRALQPVRWRIGRQFTAEPVEIAAESLSEDQMQALMDDPLLAVDVIAPE